MAISAATAVISVLTVWAFGVGLCATPHHAPAPAVDCSTVVMNMVDCLSYVTNGSTVTKPEGTCCSGLKTVLKTDAQCLCETFKNSAQLGVTLNVSKALTLPAACHVSAPSIGNCGLEAASGPAPAVPPTTASPEAGAPTPAAAVGENLRAPAPSPQSSGSALVMPVATLVFALVAASLSLF